MRTLFAVASLFAVVLLVSCSKSNSGGGGTIGDSTTTATRLSAWGNSFSQFNLEYDGSGRIIRVKYKIGNGAEEVLYNLTYSGNEILIAAPPVNDANQAGTDTLYIYLDANNRIASTARRYFKHAKATTYPQRVYQNEIVNYQYDAAGFLIKQIRLVHDSILTNYGYIETRIANTVDTVIRTHAAGNIASVTDNRNVTSIVRTPSNETSAFIRTEFTNTLSYDKGYQNKADFTNQAVLSKFINLSPFQFDSKYNLLPNKVSTHAVEKDATGRVLNTFDLVDNYDYTYGANGLVYSRLNHSSTEGKIYYGYK